MSEKGGEVHGFFIIDVSSLSKGLGTIKKWFENDEYVVKLFIPSYTIHELDFLKSGNSMVSWNARESVRFMDKLYSPRSIIDESKPYANNNHSELTIETEEEVGPSWKRCMRYKVRTPKIAEFQGVQSINSLSTLSRSHPGYGDTSKSGSSISADSGTEIKYESDLLEEGINGLSINGSSKNPSPDRNADLPTRLKYLIRPCIKKTKLDEEDWVLVTEDPSTKIWCESFDIPSVSLAEAEKRLFYSKNKDRLPQSERFQAVCPIGATKKRRKGPRKGSFDTIANNREKDDVRNENSVVIERFNVVSYAPRGNGELWVP